MAKLYGLGNYLISEMATKLMVNPHFNKFVYYKDTDEDSGDILSMPDLEDPVSELYKKQVWIHRRPQKVLHFQDVNVFLYLDDQRNYNAKSKRIKTVFIKVSVLVHEKCLVTANGSRDIALLSCIENILENDVYFKSLGELSIDRVNPLFGLPLEYSGYELVCKIDGFTNNSLMFNR